MSLPATPISQRFRNGRANLATMAVLSALLSGPDYLMPEDSKVPSSRAESLAFWKTRGFPFGTMGGKARRCSWHSKRKSR